MAGPYGPQFGGGPPSTPASVGGPGPQFGSGPPPMPTGINLGQQFPGPGGGAMPPAMPGNFAGAPQLGRPPAPPPPMPGMRPQGGFSGGPGGAFNMQPQRPTGGQFGPMSKAPMMTGQAQPFAGSNNRTSMR